MSWEAERARRSKLRKAQGRPAGKVRKPRKRGRPAGEHKSTAMSEYVMEMINRTGCLAADAFEAWEKQHAG